MAVRHVLQNYANFNGRAGRSEYWYWVLAVFAVNVALTVADRILGLGFLPGLFGLVVLVPGLAVGVRRLHDVSKSGWWLLVNLIPLLGWVYFIYLVAQPSDEAPNDYGDGPAAA